MNFGLVFYAFHYLVLGYLVLRSGYLPKFLGVLLMVASVCLLTSSFAQFVAPDFADLIFPAIDVPAGLADLFLGIWLLFKGVNLTIWKSRTTRELLRPER